MKLFDDFLKNNKDEFDIHEPESDHFVRFKNKMKNTEKRNNVFNLKFLLKVAVVIFPIGIISLLLVYSEKSKSNVEYAKVISENYFSAELNEIEIYFNDRIEKKMDEFQNLECFMNESDKAEIIKDLEKIDYSINNLTMELKNSSKNEKIMNAIILNYQSKDEILEKVIIQIKENC
jgi:hypothetical protein